MGMITQESPQWGFQSGDPHLGIPTMGIYFRGRAIIVYGWSKGAGGCASWYGGAGGRASWQVVEHHAIGLQGGVGAVHHNRMSCDHHWKG